MPQRDPSARTRNGTVALLLSFAGCVHGPTAPPWPAVLQPDATFTLYSPLSRSAEVARRVLSPLTFQHAQQGLAAKGQVLREQPIDLLREKFTLYVPAVAPPKRGYGLLVFVSPWPEATDPEVWRPPLDRHGLIFVAAANSGNGASVVDRRLPLALLAYENVRARYPLDPERIYVGGLSGGSRVAEIAALGYPDVFRGALLNAGSEPIGGEKGMFLPPADLFRIFQRTRLVYATGDHDEFNLADDRVSRQSMEDWCVFDVETVRAPRVWHEPLDAISFNRALDALERRSAIDGRKLEECNARVRRELSAKLADAEAALARGDRDGAHARIQAIDLRYGGLAAPVTAELQAKLNVLSPGAGTR